MSLKNLNLDVFTFFFLFTSDYNLNSVVYDVT